MWHCRITVIAFMLLALTGFSQKRHAINISTNDGLPTTSIRSFHKDSRGYLWIGTDAGVVKYDGINMVVYNGSDGLPGEKIWDIDEDWNGNMWFACFGGGVARFDGQKITAFTEKEGLPDNSIRKFKCHIPTRTYVYGTGITCGTADSTFSNFHYANILSGDSTQIITAILLDSLSAIVFDFRSHAHKRINFINNSVSPLSSTWINNYKPSAATVLHNQDTLLTNDRTGIVIKNNMGITEIDSIGQVFGIEEDPEETIWIASWNGGANISPPGGLFTVKNNTLSGENKTYGIESILGWCLDYDTLQSYMLYGTLDMGAYIIPKPYFTCYDAAYFNEEYLNVKDVVCDKNETVYSISNDMLYIFEPDGNFNKIDAEKLYTIRQSFYKENMSGEALRTILNKIKSDYQTHRYSYTSINSTTKNELLFNIMGLGCFIYTDKEKIKPISFYGSYFSLDENDTIVQCDEWAYEIKKHGHYKNVNNCFTRYEVPGKRIMAKKHFRYQNETWLCSRISGLFMEKDCAIRDLNAEDSTINHLVNAICFDSIGTAYIGGNDGRIEVLSPIERKKIYEVSHKKTLPAILWMEIWKGYLFAGHADGLRIYKLNEIASGNISFRFFGETEGNIYRNVNNSDIDKQGNIWLAANSGLIKVDANLILNTKYYPLKSIIDNVELFNKESDWGHFGETNKWTNLPKETVKLTYEENNLSIHYHTINFVNPDAEEYYYKLDGIDNEWIGPTEKTYVVYPYLKSGTYNFQLKSRNHTSGLDSNEASFSFIILKPWYFQLWFIIAMLLIFITLVYLFYKIRINNIRRQEQQKREITNHISELETKALQAQMNPHFIFNSMSSIQNFIIDNNVDEALLFMGHFSKVIRKTLDHIDNKKISLQEELEYLEHYTELEKMRFDNSFEFIVTIDDNIDTINTDIPPMILQPFIENSVKHAFPDRSFHGKITLTINAVDEECYCCIIEDNGIGRAAAEINKTKINLGHHSRGMKITQDRIKMLNHKDQHIYHIQVTDLVDDLGNAAGTRVKIVLPLNM